MLAVITGVVLAVTVLAQAVITRRLWRSELYERGQMIAQTALIWILPVLGAVVVHAGLRHQDNVPRLRPNPKGGEHESLWGPTPEE